MLFSTLRFLRISMEKTARRRRIQNWLLLALRALLFGLLAFAVAQPIFKSSDLRFGEAQLAAVIVVDNSMSMGTAQEKGTRLDRAKRAVRQLLTDNPRPTREALVFTNGAEARQPPKWEANRREAVQHLMAANVGIGRASLGPVLTQAVKLLDDPSLQDRAIYVISDLQDITFKELREVQALEGLEDVPLMFINCAERKPRNVAVADLKLGEEGRVAGSPVRVDAKVINSGPTPEQVGVGIQGDGHFLASLYQTVQLTAAGTPGSVAWVSFECTFAEAGWHTGRVLLMQSRPSIRGLASANLTKLAWSDDLPGDDRRWFSLWTVDQIRAVLVATDTQEQGPQTADFYLRAALDVRASSIQTRRIEPKDLSAEQIKDANVVFCCDVPAPSGASGEALSAFVRRGGTLVFFLGPNYVPQEYNAALGPLLPGQLREPLGSMDLRGQARRLQWVAMDNPVFSRLYEKMSSYQMVLVWRYARVDLDPAGTPEVLARLDNDDPLLIQQAIGAGQVYVFVTTANTLWTDLPTRPLFLPTVIRICLQAGGMGPQVQSIAENGPAKLLLRSDQPQTVEVQFPQKYAGQRPPVRVTSKIEEAGNMAVFQQTYRPGVYHWQTTTAPQQSGTFVVNHDGAESDLTSMDANKVLAESPAGKATFVANNNQELAKLVEQQRRGSPLWDYVLYVVLLFAVLECLLANRRRPAEQAFRPAAGPQGSRI